MKQALWAFGCVAAGVSVVWGQNRPQEPVEPYPYEAIEVVIPCGDGDEPTHTLAGTLTIPDEEEFGGGPFVGVVLLTGSGAQNRDEEILGHKPFLVLADYLTRNGIVVLRFDDRGVGGSTGSFAGTTTLGFADDGQTAAHFMMQHAKIDPKRVGLMGHSEGGVEAPYIAARDESIAFIVLLAGTGVPGSEILLDQAATMYRAGGKDEEYIAGSVERRGAFFDAIHADAEDDELLALLMELNRFEYGMEEVEQARKMTEQVFPLFTDVWIKEFVKLDPRESLRRVRVPVLALNGSKDFQVPPRMNLDSIRGALEEGGNTRHTVIELAGLNHLFQHAETGLLDEYSTIEETFAPQALALIEAWIRTEIIEGQ